MRLSRQQKVRVQLYAPDSDRELVVEFRRLAKLRGSSASREILTFMRTYVGQHGESSDQHKVTVTVDERVLTGFVYGVSSAGGENENAKLEPQT